MTAVLGLSAFYHDAAAALIVDGRVVAASQQERFSRKKHDDAFPAEAIADCLAQAGLTADDLDYVAFYEKPLRKFDRWLNTVAAYAPRGYRAFRQAVPNWLKLKLYLRRALEERFPTRRRLPLVFTEHHEAHAASAFFPSPFESAAILTIDGVGEWSTTTIGIGRGGRLELLDEMRFPHSLGLLYAAFTYYCGFRINSGEYKLMGLAPYGQPVYRDVILERLLDLKEDGSFRLDMRYFRYGYGLTMTSRKFDRLFGGTPRSPESEITDRYKNLAASIQSVTEEIMLRQARFAYRRTGESRLVMAGGVALNCVGNGRIFREGPFRELWIQPAAGDAGGAVGAAWFVWHQLLGEPRAPVGVDRQQASFLGPAFPGTTVEAALTQASASFVRCDSFAEVCRRVAKALAQQKVVGWFQGRMEFGPRALGSRSILGDPRDPKMQSQLNMKIKFRESFRPFAPSILREHASRYFDVPDDFESPYMLLVAPVRPEFRHHFPAITHVDGTARIQTVDAQRQPYFHALIEEFYRVTGCPMVINTSFNVRGEPMVCSPEEAYRGFIMTDMDLLAIDHFLLYKTEQSSTIDPNERDNFQRAYHAFD
jgi:carbamoyltransferase